jgi:hypothetical protein
MQLFVKMLSRTTKVDVQGGHTMRDVKDAIEVRAVRVPWDGCSTQAARPGEGAAACQAQKAADDHNRDTLASLHAEALCSRVPVDTTATSLREPPRCGSAARHAARDMLRRWCTAVAWIAAPARNS